MNKNKSMSRKRLHNATVITKRIISIFKKLKFMENEANNDNTFFQKHIDLLEELVENEQAICEKLSREEDYQDVVRQVMDNPAQFQADYGIKGNGFSRFFRNLFIYDYNKNGESDINILNIMPEFSHLDFKATNQHYPQLFKAFSEDLFYTYIKLIDRKINQSDNQKQKKVLLDEKYKIYSVYANTNQFYLDETRNKEHKIESKAALVIDEIKLDERLYDFLVTDFAYSFCNEFFDNALSIEDRDFQKINLRREGYLKLVLLESVLSLIPHSTIENLENMFYKKYYEINYNFDYQNKKASALVVDVFEKMRKKPKVLTI